METVKNFFKDDIFKHILNVFNISFTTGAFSDKVKLSNDTPIHKKKIQNQNALANRLMKFLDFLFQPIWFYKKL